MEIDIETQGAGEKIFQDLMYKNNNRRKGWRKSRRRTVIERYPSERRGFTGPLSSVRDKKGVAAAECNVVAPAAAPSAKP